MVGMVRVILGRAHRPDRQAGAATGWSTPQLVAAFPAGILGGSRAQREGSDPKEEP